MQDQTAYKQRPWAGLRNIEGIVGKISSCHHNNKDGTEFRECYSDVMGRQFARYLAVINSIESEPNRREYAVVCQRLHGVRSRHSTSKHLDGCSRPKADRHLVTIGSYKGQSVPKWVADRHLLRSPRSVFDSGSRKSVVFFVQLFV